MAPDFAALPAPLPERLASAGFAAPTPAQAAALETGIAAGRSGAIVAPTGTGKTLAYALPILARMAPYPEPAEPPVAALVVVPSQELGIQVRDAFKAVYPEARATALIGGANPARQKEALKRHPRVVVGTPGRLWEMVLTKRLALGAVQVLVVDEADTLLTGEHAETLSRLREAVRKNAQVVLASATLDADAPYVKAWIGEEGAIARVEGAGLSPTLEHLAFVVDPRERLPMIRKLVRRFAPEGAIAFVNRAADVDFIVSKLRHHDLAVEGLSARTPALERTRVMREFRAKRLQLLVTTELAARGLDLAQVSAVFNFDLPTDPTHYVHRVGRTARMGRAGRAITVASPQEAFVLTKIEKALGFTFERPVYAEGEVREATEIDLQKAERKASKTKRTEAAKAEAAEAPKPKKKAAAPARTKNQVEKGKARKAARKAAGAFKKAASKPASQSSRS